MFVWSESEDRSSRVSAYSESVFEFAWRRKHAIYKRPVAVETESKLRLHCARLSLHSNTTKARNNPQQLTSDQSFTSRLRDCKVVHQMTNQIQRIFLSSTYSPVRASVRWRSTRTKVSVNHSVSHTYSQENAFCYQVRCMNKQLPKLITHHTTNLCTCEYISVGLLKLIRTTALPITNNTWPMY